MASLNPPTCPTSYGPDPHLTSVLTSYNYKLQVVFSTASASSRHCIGDKLQSSLTAIIISHSHSNNPITEYYSLVLTQLSSYIYTSLLHL